MKTFLTLFSVLILSGLNFSAYGQTAQSNKILTDSQGMTAYVFDNDKSGVVSCYGACANAWPPIPAPATPVAAPFTVVQRTDGRTQLAFQGRPIYLYIGDAAPGDTNGNGLGGIWHIIPQ